MSDHDFSVFVGLCNRPTVGDWIEIYPGMDEDEIMEAIRAALPAHLSDPEWIIADVENIPFDLVGEYAGPDHLAQLAAAAEVAESNGIPLAVLWFFADLLNIDDPDSIGDIPDYLTCWGSWDDYIAQWCELWGVSEKISYYIDAEAVQRDAEIDGTFGEIDGELWEYWG